MIYLDNAATSRPKPQAVIDAVVEAMSSFGNGGRGSHNDALAASRLIYDTRELVVKLFHGVDPQHVVFTSNSTEALNTTLLGLFGPEDHIISTDLEHNSVLRPLHELQGKGAHIDFLTADKKGKINLEHMSNLLRSTTKAVVCTHGSNVTGDLVDIERVGEFCNARDLLFILDASQTAGVFPIDMEKQHINVVCFTGHKSLLGPTGTGGICFDNFVDIRPLKYGGTGVQSFSKTQPEEYPTRLEAGTLNSHGLAGLNAALRLRLEEGIESYRSIELDLARRFYEGVKRLPNIKIYGDFTTLMRAPIVTLNLGDEDAAMVADELAQVYGIATRAGAHCAPRLHEALGTAQQGAVRFSWSSSNTVEETDMAIRAIEAIAKELG